MAIPSTEKLFKEIHLYERIKISEEDSLDLYNILFINETIDVFCPFCKLNSTFKKLVPGARPVIHTLELAKEHYPLWTNHVINVMYFECTRRVEHKGCLLLYLTPENIIKIGQFPSIADLSVIELKKYREILTEEKYRELNRGIGLITHGVGIGAFVYLRRIFEDLIEEAHQKNIKENKSWNEDSFQRGRMDEKIKLLEHDLPKFLVEHRTIYSILSKGIHELSEEECLNYFPSLKLAVELVLDQKLERKRQNDKIKAAALSIQKINQELRK